MPRSPAPCGAPARLTTMRTRGTLILVALFALFALGVVAGCGSSSEETGATATSQSQEAPAGVRAKACESSEGEIRVTGVPCGFGRLIVAGWHKDNSCSAPAGASRTSCRLGKFTCQGASTDQGIAVTCAGVGRSISFIAKPR